MTVVSLSTQVEHAYTGPLDDELGDAMLSCNPEVQTSGHNMFAVTATVLRWKVVISPSLPLYTGCSDVSCDKALSNSRCNCLPCIWESDQWDM